MGFTIGMSVNSVGGFFFLSLSKFTIPPPPTQGYIRLGRYWLSEMNELKFGFEACQW